ncbi:MAG: hypothetical protein IKH38_03335 [Clostridia bacterium]|nr:hypothetical protein [Clostridia bacterium]
MSEIEKKALEYTDAVEPDEEQPEPLERPYPDGSAVHECWAQDEDR